MALAREWIIFALCLGAGGHLALGFVLHAPDLWPWSRAGLYGLLSGLVIYVLVQVMRFLWSRMHAKRADLEQDAGD
jgi:Zn-dependent protease with chaperone function